MFIEIFLGIGGLPFGLLKKDELSFQVALMLVIDDWPL